MKPKRPRLKIKNNMQEGQEISNFEPDTAQDEREGINENISIGKLPDMVVDIKQNDDKSGFYEETLPETESLKSMYSSFDFEHSL